MSTRKEKENSINNSNNNNENNSNNNTSNNKAEEEEEKDVPLPGFRFHPTDEELVSFYLRRKVGKKPMSIELIKQIDIYKFDPWDLPRVGNVGDREWYFFCLRGRKYKNSVRPNRVTGSGFWKATGIDKPIHSAKEPHGCIIGLKKSLVYYRGSAGKGTKTDWMMHEFRLPPPHPNDDGSSSTTPSISQEAEIWTLCRIFRRESSHKKYNANPTAHHNNNGTSLETTQRKASSISSQSTSLVNDKSAETCSLENEVDLELNSSQFFSPCHSRSEPHDLNAHQVRSDHDCELPPQELYHQAPTLLPAGPSYCYPTLTTNPNPADNDFFTYGNWDELRSVVQLADRNSSRLDDKLPHK